jgi:hypothetical protein
VLLGQPVALAAAVADLAAAAGVPEEVADLVWEARQLVVQVLE